MITPVETRWNSSLMMMRSVIQMRSALEEIKESTRATEVKLQDLIPESFEFDVIETIIPILT